MLYPLSYGGSELQTTEQYRRGSRAGRDEGAAPVQTTGPTRTRAMGPGRCSWETEKTRSNRLSASPGPEPTDRVFPTLMVPPGPPGAD
jgi:hypothetical protein